MSEGTSTTRRTVLRSIGALPAVAAATVASESVRDGDGTDEPEHSPRARSHIATVDRIVDGDHVVLLLEDGGEVVDQLVVTSGAFAGVEEGDIAVVVVEDGEPLAHLFVPERPCSVSAGDSDPLV